MTNRQLPWWARALLALLRGVDAEVIRGDLVERHQRESSTDITFKRGRWAFFLDVLETLVNWWRPSAVRRRRLVHGNVDPPHTSTMGIRFVISDVRFALRSLGRRPGFALVVLATLGLGIGATTTIFSVVDAVVVRPLPYAEADQLLALGNTFPGREWDDEEADLQHLAGVSVLNFLDWRARARSVSELAAIETAVALLPDEGNGPEVAPMARVTENFFGLFRTAPLMGRMFLPEDHVEANGALILSYGAWQERFGGDPAIIGTSVPTAGTSFTIVGVLPKDFVQPEAIGAAPVDFWVPLDSSHPRYEWRGRRSLYVFGRLAAGATIGGARAELDGIQAQLAVDAADGNVFPNGDRLGAGVNALHAETVGSSGRTLNIFFAASLMLLLIAGLNTANLLLVRGLDRRDEIAIRRALGANRGRLILGLMTESLVLSIGGFLVGIVIAVAGVRAFLTFAPSSLPRLGEVSIDLRIVLISTLVSVVGGLAIGLIPALDVTGHTVTATAQKYLSTSRAPNKTRLRTILVATQLALAVMLAVGAGLLFNSFLRVAMVDPGFAVKNLTTFTMPVKRPGAPEDEKAWQAWDGILQEIRSVPGLTGVAATSVLPFHSPQWAPAVLLPGDPIDLTREGVAGYVITPDFLQVAEIPVVAGRGFNIGDGPDAAPVALVNEAFVRTHLNGEKPIGTTIRIRESENHLNTLTVVGVVQNVVQTRGEEGSRPAIYVPYTQSDWGNVNIIVRSERDFAGLVQDLRRAAARFTAWVPLLNVESMESRVRWVRTEPRFQTILLTSFACVALLLAVIGLYGSLAHAVGNRTREMGIRMALGAPRADIFRLVFLQGVAVLTGGIVVGLAGALFFTRFLRGFLFEVGTLDLTSFAGALVVLCCAACLAIVVPARRATGVNVVESLRTE